MRALSGVLLISVMACGGRVANPVALENDFDDRLSCAHLSGEYDNNIKRLEELTGEERAQVANNAGLLVTSPFFLDFSDTIKEETKALLARNERLTILMAERSCSPQGTPAWSMQAPVENAE